MPCTFFELVRMVQCMDLMFSLSEAIEFVDFEAKKNNFTFLSGQKLIEKGIENGIIAPLFKFEGYALANIWQDNYISWGVRGLFKDDTFESYNLFKYLPSSTSQYPFDFKDLNKSKFMVNSVRIIKIESAILIFNTDNNKSANILDYEKRIGLYDIKPEIEWQNSCESEDKLLFIDRENILFDVSELNLLISKYVISQGKLNYVDNNLESLNRQLQLTIDSQAKQIAQLQRQLEQKAGEPSHTDKPVKSEGQGDSLLILGAVMETLDNAVIRNYNQNALIYEVLEKYKSIHGISEGTLKKKFAESKKYLNQNIID